MEKEIHQRTLQFSLQIIKLVNALPKTTAGFEIGKQLLRSGTSIGANMKEDNGAVSRREFINFIEISKKSALETEYWLQLIAESKMGNEEVILSLIAETKELQKILAAIVLKLKRNAG